VVGTGGGVVVGGGAGVTAPSTVNVQTALASHVLSPCPQHKLSRSSPLLQSLIPFKAQLRTAADHVEADKQVPAHAPPAIGQHIVPAVEVADVNVALPPSHA